MNWQKLWNKVRRWLGFPGFDYTVETDVNRFADYYLHIMDMDIRPEIAEWLDEEFARKNWKAEFSEEGSRVIFKFRYVSHATHFKLSWV